MSILVEKAAINVKVHEVAHENAQSYHNFLVTW
jgi:hypothetical protein